jgi:hypothetical protein
VKKYGKRQNICKFERRIMQREKISATLGEVVCGQIK